VRWGSPLNCKQSKEKVLLAVDPLTGRGASLSVEEFPALSEGCRKLIIPHGEGCSSEVRAGGTSNMVRENFISLGMFRITKHDDLEWKKKHAEEIKEMFKSPHLQCVEALELMHAEVVTDPTGQDEVMVNLDSSACMLEAALMRMEKLGKWEQGDRASPWLMGHSGLMGLIACQQRMK
jgi:hypothetical protein